MSVTVGVIDGENVIGDFDGLAVVGIDVVGEREGSLVDGLHVGATGLEVVGDKLGWEAQKHADVTLRRQEFTYLE